MGVIFLNRKTRAVTLACLGAAAIAPAAHASSTQTTFFEAPRDLTGVGAQPSTDASRAAAFGDFEALGVKALRVNMPWYNVAPAADGADRPAFDAADPAAYNWGNFGTTIDEAKRRGWKVLISPSAPVPKWATAARADTVTRPNADEFKLFTTAAAKRFGGPTVMWSIWNEPNLPRFLAPQVSGGKRVAGKLYRELFLKGREGIRSAPGLANAPVLFGETAPVGGANDQRTYPLVFLRDALCATSKYKLDKSCGSKLTLDGIAHHPYQFTYGKLSSNDVTFRNLSRLTTFVDKTAKGGANNKGLPVYFTEFGIQSTPDPLLGLAPQDQLEVRARVERDAYFNSRVRGFSQYLLTDDNPTVDTEGCKSFGGFETGLRYAATGKPKPSFEGFRSVLDAKPNGKKVSIWGLVRPATGATTVVLERATSKKGAFRTWKKVRTKSNGAFTASDTKRSGARYRFRWTGPQGKVTSPYVRVASGNAKPPKGSGGLC